MKLMLKVAAAVAVAFTAATAAHSGVSPAEAAKLKAELTPLGAERAANKDGTIPAWTGGLTTPTPGYKGGRRPDPFANEKPILQITAKNMDARPDFGTVDPLRPVAVETLAVRHSAVSLVAPAKSVIVLKLRMLAQPGGGAKKAAE